MPQQHDISRTYKKIDILKNKIDSIKHIDITKIDKILYRYKSIYEDKQKMFYDINTSKTKALTTMQKNVENMLKQNHLKDYQVDWIEDANDETISIKLSIKCNKKELKRVFDILTKMNKLIKVVDMNMIPLGGADHKKRVYVILILQSYRMAK
jgi:hypothetical protein